MTNKIETGPYVLGFNGPPRAGKDTAMNLFADHVDRSRWINAPIIERPLAMPMRKMAFAALGLDYSFDRYETLKDLPCPALAGQTIRQFMIALSEEFMKQKFGKEIWCRLWLESIPKNFNGIVLVPDVGFQVEANFMLNHFGYEDVVIVQVGREGKTFEGDSRENVSADQKFTLTNNGTIDDMRVEIARLAGRLTNKYRWKI
jgi:hypothetical protein